MPSNLIAATSLCLIVSADGKAWRRPSLGLATWNASKNNNIVWPLQDHSACAASGNGRQKCPSHGAYVFHDDNPATPPSERFKLFSHQSMPGHENQTGGVEKGQEGVCSMWPLDDAKEPVPGATSWCPTILVSGDGLNFEPPAGGLRVSTYQRYGSSHSDCQLQFWDQAAGKYVAGCQMPCITIVNGRDNFTCLTSTEGQSEGHRLPGRICPRPNATAAERTYVDGNIRRIGRCAFDDLYDWNCDTNSTHVSTVLSFDETDPDCVDLYTQTQMVLDARDRVFLPSAYHHLILDVPRGNDGLIDIRMAVSRDGGRSAHYPSARDGRRPFVQLGANHCPLKSSPDASPRGMMWCDAKILEAPGSNRSSRDAVTGSLDTSVMYALNGRVEAEDGEHLFL
jgi:hypothetical protein